MTLEKSILKSIARNANTRTRKKQMILAMNALRRASTSIAENQSILRKVMNDMIENTGKKVVVGKVISAKEDEDGLTIKVDTNPFGDSKAIFDDFYNMGIRPSVILADTKTNYSKMYHDTDNRRVVGYVPYGAIHIQGLRNDIVAIYVNKKKEIVALKWSDGEITKVHRRKGDKFDLEAAVNAAIVKRLISSHTEYQKRIEAITEYQD